ncbi:MAG: SDR family oxidoreductase [Devosia nanyangense]|uniref:SDR family oxidoreductase n=1 Tax=Devosia nanyangense TaxID=1228055 RepID=A0A933NX59_9HYPH|nr:SDR family oxidoreductase [Devosia nanyangense]
MKISVFGASGGVGRRVVEQLLAAGHEVTAVVRDPGRMTSAGSKLRIIAIPDLGNQQAIIAAVQGQDAVVSGIGPRSTRDGPVASTATASILGAMRAAGVRRLVTVSAAPVGDMPADEGLFARLILYPLARTLLRRVFEDLGKMETDMWRSGLDCTAVRPPRLTDGPLTGRYRRRVGGSVPRGTVISRADTAHAMVAALSDPATIGQPVGVAN